MELLLAIIIVLLILPAFCRVTDKMADSDKTINLRYWEKDSIFRKGNKKSEKDDNGSCGC
jgi:hypothetical protein